MFNKTQEVFNMVSNDPQHSATSDRFLRWPEVKNRVGYSRSQVHLLIKQGRFPAPVKLGARASAWLQSSIDQWISGRVVASKMMGEGQERAAL
jgi:prophage regulatory protein